MLQRHHRFAAVLACLAAAASKPAGPAADTGPKRHVPLRQSLGGWLWAWLITLWDVGPPSWFITPSKYI
jgi:hypothetical protein